LLQPLHELPRLALLLVSIAAAVVAITTSWEVKGARSAPADQRGSPSLAALRICGDTGLPHHVERYRYVILQAWSYSAIATIKARNPRTKVLVYKDMASTRDDAVRRGVDQKFIPTGVGYVYANRRHPEWFLKDTSGSRVAWASWPHYWQMDVGSASYQRAWSRNVAREVRRRGWDGVFVDGAAATMQYPWYLNGRVLAKYPREGDYTRATTSFLRRVGPALKRAHSLVVTNINDAPPAVWRRWVGYSSGTSKEWWTKNGTGRGGFMTGKEWSFQMRLLSQARARGKIFIAITYGQPNDSAAMRYARASFLLFAGARSALSYSTACGGDAWSPEWTTSLGRSRGRAFRVGPAWRRNFAGGTAIVNPSGAPVTVPLGASYLTPTGAPVVSVLLQPGNGLVLRRA
jgi:Hypothetical glycosyl hydrolase family 15